MTCKETTQLVSQYVDNVLSLPARIAIDEHLHKCPVCRTQVAELRNVSRSLRSLSRPVAPPDLASSITDALMIEAAARRQSPEPSLRQRIALWLEPRLMPYSISSFASVVLFISMFAAFRPHFVAMQDAAIQTSTVQAFQASPHYDLSRPVNPADFSAARAPFGAQSPSLDPGGALAALTGSYANPPGNLYQEADDMVVVADVFSNGSAALADVVQAPRDRQMLTDFEVALRQSAAFVPASWDRRPDTMRVVFTVQKVDVRDRSF
jgi:hypothetical protein